MSNDVSLCVVSMDDPFYMEKCTFSWRKPLQEYPIGCSWLLCTSAPFFPFLVSKTDFEKESWMRERQRKMTAEEGMEGVRHFYSKFWAFVGLRKAFNLEWMPQTSSISIKCRCTVLVRTMILLAMPAAICSVVCFLLKRRMRWCDRCERRKTMGLDVSTVY